MTIKEKIEADFITAFKTKDINAKAALSGIKAKITEAEKSTPYFIATDSEVIKILNKAIKQREESAKIYETAGRRDLAGKEFDEVNILKEYMPNAMTTQEITDVLIKIMKDFTDVKNNQALIGKTIGEFNKKYMGRADIGIVRHIANQLVDV